MVSTVVSLTNIDAIFLPNADSSNWSTGIALAVSVPTSISAVVASSDIPLAVTDAAGSRVFSIVPVEKTKLHYRLLKPPPLPHRQQRNCQLYPFPEQLN